MEQFTQETETLRISQVGSYEDAQKLTNKRVRTLEEYIVLNDGDTRAATREFGHHQYESIVTALNLNPDGSEYDADYNDMDQKKHLLVWDMETYNDDAPGSGFALLGVGFGYDFAYLGARLHPRTEKLGEHLAVIGKEAARMWIRG